MENNSLALLNKFGLAKTGSFNYSDQSNAFLGNGFTSAAGNTYFNSLRFVEGILVKEDVGQGYSRTFINAIRIYDIKSKDLLCEKSYHCAYYSKSFLENEVVNMLTQTLMTAAKKENVYILETEIRSKIVSLVRYAFTNDQRQILYQQSQKYLGA